MDAGCRSQVAKKLKGFARRRRGRSCSVLSSGRDNTYAVAGCQWKGSPGAKGYKVLGRREGRGVRKTILRSAVPSCGLSLWAYTIYIYVYTRTPYALQPHRYLHILPLSPALLARAHGFQPCGTALWRGIRGTNGRNDGKKSSPSARVHNIGAYTHTRAHTKAAATVLRMLIPRITRPYCALQNAPRRRRRRSVPVVRPNTPKRLNPAPPLPIALALLITTASYHFTTTTATRARNVPSCYIDTGSCVRRQFSNYFFSLFYFFIFHLPFYFFVCSCCSLFNTIIFACIRGRKENVIRTATTAVAKNNWRTRATQDLLCTKFD